ncbi:uncharacterized protein MYCFIDRAFT_173784 [Pseudocercospora fijiensis CIRAD86]|uniref:Uncharacterized protein n=1 Tax=Pseudocercospora fijiensis (strain CIRAD86) TaxID=383855 RepID=M3B693_PSEFD|nr:uncharacterized protein MYCFIDRAFT_173784 [Pseudocercospora fijiensis CIRAD86]EME84887.1 hypothetical protein MYCFIDRAFT_173784 [Pseudocercospora fijiensis CIRAD86]
MHNHPVHACRTPYLISSAYTNAPTNGYNGYLVHPTATDRDGSDYHKDDKEDNLPATCASVAGSCYAFHLLANSDQ